MLKKPGNTPFSGLFLCPNSVWTVRFWWNLNGNLWVYSGQITGGQAHFDLLWVKLLVDNRSKWSPILPSMDEHILDTFVNSEDCTCIRNFCKEIGIPEKTAVALLLDHRYLYRSPSGWLMPFADKSARGYFIVRDCYGRSGKLVQQTRVTCKGKNHLFKLFKKWGVIEWRFLQRDDFRHLNAWSAWKKTEFDTIRKNKWKSIGVAVYNRKIHWFFYALAVSWNHGGGSYDKQTALRR